jgi:hypothetical protein
MIMCFFVALEFVPVWRALAKNGQSAHAIKRKRMGDFSLTFKLSED